MQEFDALNNAEVNDFRFQMRKLADEVAGSRSKKSWLDRLYYQFPPRLAAITLDHLECNTVFQNGCIALVTKMEYGVNEVW